MNPADTIREALAHGGHKPRNDKALAALTELEQQLAAPRTEQEHRWRNEVRRCQHERDAAEADRDRYREALEQMGCLGDHYCPGNDNFLGDVWEDEDTYDPAKWPLCKRCAALTTPDTPPDK